MAVRACAQGHLCRADSRNLTTPSASEITILPLAGQALSCAPGGEPWRWGVATVLQGWGRRLGGWHPQPRRSPLTRRLSFDPLGVISLAIGLPTAEERKDRTIPAAPGRGLGLRPAL